MTSTNCITGAGLKKCIPITRSDFSQELAIDVIDNDDVFDAKIQFSETIFSKSANNFCLISKFSIMASMTKSEFDKSDTFFH
jgi:hypothetical protein